MNVAEVLNIERADIDSSLILVKTWSPLGTTIIPFYAKKGSDVCFV